MTVPLRARAGLAAALCAALALAAAPDWVRANDGMRGPGAAATPQPPLQARAPRLDGPSAEPSGVGTGLLAGAAPLLAANLVNAGSVLATTYSPTDASAPVLSLAAAWRGLPAVPGRRPSA